MAWRQILGREGLQWDFAGEKAGLAEEEWDLGGRQGQHVLLGKLPAVKAEREACCS